jgi:hypothetical protein
MDSILIQELALCQQWKMTPGVYFNKTLQEVERTNYNRAS